MVQKVRKIRPTSEKLCIPILPSAALGSTIPLLLDIAHRPTNLHNYRCHKGINYNTMDDVISLCEIKR